MLPILQPGPTDGGTKYGSSLYETALTCPKKANYYKDKWEPGVLDFGDGAAAIGSYFHKLTEHYHRGTLPTSPILVSDLDCNDAAIEAVRLFNFYKKHIPTNAFGKILGVEDAVLHDSPNFHLGRTAFDGLPFTGKFDLVVELDTAGVSAWDKFGGVLPGPGVYIVDYKTRSKSNFLAADGYKLSIQGRAYPLLYNAISNTPCRGMIFLEIYKTKACGISTFFVPTLEGEAKEGFIKTLKNADKMLNIGFANPTACFNYFRKCELLENGACNGY